MKYFLVAHRILAKLSKEFDVEVPELLIDCPTEISGYYCCGEVHINEEILRSMHDTIVTVRHEFAHYLQDLWNINRKPEVLAHRFEKNLLALGKLPKCQTVLAREREETQSHENTS